uniref:Translocation/assembly module TamB domain-containing protein n=1 Tax=Roseihalotalea indica TaxID=2867963 RepID=A0AA49JHX5_9BACT|nr:translocation/assembly module TamB domain-containing protein [Tunicatimonas sp. TK19036]
MVIGIMFGLWLVVYIALRTPPVQRFVTNKIAQQLEKQIGTPVSLEGIDIEWLDGIELTGLYLEDQQQDTLLYLGRLQVEIEPWALLNKTLIVDLIEVRDMYVNIYKVPGKDSLNFAYIPAAFASSDTTTQVKEDTTSSSFTIEARRLLLGDIRVDFKADSTEAHVALGELSLLLETLGLEEEHIQADELSIDRLAVALRLPRTSAPDSTAQPEAPTPDSLKNVINPSGYAFSLADFSINNTKIDYQVGPQRQADSVAQMNFENLLIADLGIHITDVEVGRTSAALNLEQFTFAEQRSGFELQEFALAANVDMPQVQATLQQLQTGHSNLNGTVDIKLALEENTADLINSLTFQSQLNKAVLSMVDAGYFTNALDSMPSLKNAEANLWWNANITNGSGGIQDLQLRLDDRFALQGNLQLQDLAKIDSAAGGSPTINLSVDPIQTNLAFLRQIMGDDAGLPRLANDTLILQASAEGQLDDIKGNLSLNSSIGKLLAEGTYQQATNGGMNVNASVQGQQLQIKQLLLAMGQDTLAQDFGTLTFQARTSAKQTVTPYDTTFSEAKWDLVLNQIDYKDYSYNDLQVEGYLADEQVVTQINYQDSLLELNADANLDMRSPTMAYQLDLNLPIANLYRLNLSSDSVILQNVRLLADLKGTDPDSIVGSVNMGSATVIKDAENYTLDSLILIADRDGPVRRISFESDFIDALISGEFSVAELPTAIEDFQQYYFTAYQAPAIDQDTVNTAQAGGQKLHLELNIKETPLVARALVPDLEIPEAITFDVDFNSAEKSLQANLKAPHINYGTNIIDSLYLDVTTSQRQINIDLLSNYVQAGGLSIPKVLLAGKLSGVASENQPANRQRLTTTKLDLNLKMGEDNAPYRLDLNTRIQSQGDTVTVMMGDSEVILDSLAWDFSDQGRIVYAQNYLNIDRFFLKQGDQELFISTKNSDNRSNLEVAIEQFEIKPFLNALDLDSYDVEGIFYGKATLEDMFAPGPISADFNISNLTVQDSLVGNFKLQAKKGGTPTDEQTDLLDILASLKGPNGALEVDGSYNLAAETDALDLHVALNDFLLDPWKTFLEGQMNEFSGKLYADLDVTGSPTDPNIEGNIRFGEQVILEPTVSSARYYIENQQLDFTGEAVQLNNFTLLDSARTPAVLSGTISYADLTNPSLDLTFETSKFIFVNSYDYENEAFYGRAVASADATITGSVSDMVVDGEVTVNEGTNMTISLVSNPAEAQAAGFIEFVEGNAFIKADTAKQDSLVVMGQPTEDTVSISGFTLNSNIRLNPGAQFTIIVDPVRGDKLVAAGEADLQVNMQPNGDLTLQGNYTINRGSYLLNFAQVVKKEFAIRKGSIISWTGDPANAEMSLTAAYEVETSLEELFQDMIRGGEGGNELRNLVSTDRPVAVELIIEGTLDDPQLRFDLDLPEITAGGIYSDLVSERLKQIEQDETQLYKQVFGLIVLNRFIPVSGGLGSGESSGFASVNDQINGSVSQLLTDQLSQLTEDYLGGVELSVGLESSDQAQSQASLLADRDVNVGLSKQLFDDRLTVKVGGTTSTGNQGSQDSRIYGDFEVLYRLTETGNLQIRIFQSNDRDRITNQVRQRQGASVLYQKSFDQLFGNEDVLRGKPLPEEDEENNTQNVDSDAVLQSEPRNRKSRGGQ